MKKATFLLLIALAGIAARAQQLPAFITDSLDTYITRGMKEWDIPGLSVAIVKDGKVVVMKGFGVTEKGSTQPVDENTLFMIGSNTKLFTATALAQLEAGGKLSLDDKVQKWMPSFALRDPLASQSVTVADLLSHRIGFETFQGDFTYWTSNLTRAEITRKMASVKGLYDFRTHWGYCNAAFVTAGELIPKVIGKSWEQTVRDSILMPLGMSRTTMVYPELMQAKNTAKSHTVVNEAITAMPFADLDNLGPAGSMASSAGEMAHWLLAQLNNGQYGGKQALSAAALQATRAPYSTLAVDPRNARSTHFHLYGLGLFINDRAGKLVYSHTGGVNGFVTSVMFLPEEQLGIVVLTNTDQNSFYQNLTDEIRDAFLGLPYQNFSARSLGNHREDLAAQAHHRDSLNALIARKLPTSLPLEKYAGTYQNDLYGAVTVKAENGHLNLYFSHHPQLIGNMEHIQNDTFRCTYSDPIMGTAEIPFRTANGKAKGFTLHVADFIEFTPYEFTRK